MGATAYPQDLSFGAALIGGGLVSVPRFDGNVFYVDPANGNDTNFGTTPGLGASVNGALKTIAKALTLCTSGAGDTIFVLGSPSGSAENLVVTKDFVSIIGCQIPGYARPDVVPAAGVPLTVRANGFVAKHIRFAVANDSDCVSQQGNGFLYDDCVFDGNGAQVNTGLVRLLPSNSLTGQTASEGIIQNSYFRGTAGIGALIMDTSNLNGGSTDNQILGNRFSQNTLADIVTAKTGAAGTYSVKFVLVQGNYFMDKNKATYVDLTTNEDGAAGNQVGTLAQNGFASDTMTTTKIKAVGTAFTFMGNYDTVGVFDGSGLD
jgi:hypothetical protein